MKKTWILSFVILLCSCKVDSQIDGISASEEQTLRQFAELPETHQTTIATKDEPGQRLMVCLTLIDKARQQPLQNQQIILYHTGANGEYEASDSSKPETARLNGKVVTDQYGRAYFNTILAGDYVDSENTRHIHTIVEGARPEAYDIHFKQYTGYMGKQFIEDSDQHFLADLKKNDHDELVIFVTIACKFRR